ncbi:hypothetical protein ACLQ18_13310, partial [Streptomyces sp. DT193]|uniref:hypothetical protein n=1 Tax=Streptomyces sp. DT193 TaxID=3393418 RepID=UPI003CF8BBAB
GAVAVVGDLERARELAAEAERIARTITNLGQQVWVLAAVAGAVAVVGDLERARELAAEAERIARTITNPDQQAQALSEVAEAMAEVGCHERAEQIARTLTDPYQQAQALVGVAKVVGVARAGHLLGEAFALGSWLTPLPALAKIQPQEVIRIAGAIYAASLRVMPNRS